MQLASPARPAFLRDRAVRAALWIVYRALLLGWFVFRPQRRGVAVAVWQDGRVLAIRNSYRRWLNLPGGGIHRGEAPHEAARRELREEVGIATAPGTLHFVGEIETTFEWKRDRCSFYELVIEYPLELRVDRREVVWAGFVAPEDALRDEVTPPVRFYLEQRQRERQSPG